MFIPLSKVLSPLSNTSEPIMLNKKQQQKKLILFEIKDKPLSRFTILDAKHYWKLHCTFLKKTNEKKESLTRIFQIW